MTRPIPSPICHPPMGTAACRPLSLNPRTAPRGMKSRHLLPPRTRVPAEAPCPGRRMCIAVRARISATATVSTARKATAMAAAKRQTWPSPIPSLTTISTITVSCSRTYGLLLLLTSLFRTWPGHYRATSPPPLCATTNYEPSEYSYENGHSNGQIASYGTASYHQNGSTRNVTSSASSQPRLLPKGGKNRVSLRLTKPPSFYPAGISPVPKLSPLFFFNRTQTYFQRYSA